MGDGCLLCIQLLRREWFGLAQPTHQFHFTLGLSWALSCAPADRPVVGDPKDTSEQNRLPSPSQDFKSQRAVQ